ncbi:DUF58 domain-containing protein [Propioniferax innocua]|uniref:Uncharacterized protein (DUF58 family) n=1 Tax=Propioniferax innocua TaxID=1753 RepID=A0A542ZBL2_9ACTN|nr:DUF58 domain-containing protein [Propioniferax innocua]TQL57712.1 uncharacterized protein (DUF58 family) [Propioniferax innocua]
MRRNPWSRLTSRGRVFLITGPALVLTGMLVGVVGLVWAGLVLFLLPIVAFAFMMGSRLRLSCERAFTHGEMSIGQTLDSHLVVSKKGRMSAGILMFEEAMPPELGRRPRFTINQVRGTWSRDVHYPLHGHQRGRFTVGPLLVRSTDMFGMVKFDRQFSLTSEVMVTPRIHPLGSMGNVAGGGTSGDHRPQKLGVTGQDDVLVREYRHGDDVRRVHWRSTARRGELMVRREEQAWDPRVSVLVDNRTSAHAGVGRGNSMEYAVSCAASIACHFVAESFDASLYDADGVMASSTTTQVGRRHIISTYTDLKASDSTNLLTGIGAVSSDTSGQVLVAVLGRITQADADALVRSRRSHSHGLAIVIDVDSFSSTLSEHRTEHEKAVGVLRSNLWRVVEVDRDTPIRDAWKDLERIGEFV